MADWSFTPEDAETAKVAISGAFGATVLIYLRHPGTLLRAAFMIGLGMGIASIFSGMLASLVGLGKVQVGALLGMVGLVLARKLLDTVEKADLSQFMPWRKS